MKQIVLATRNPGKISEYQILFKSLPLEVLTLDTLGLTAEFEEGEQSFEANAIKKVLFYGSLTDLPILADDSGLEIDVLKGEPGVQSRRWPGHRASDEELINLALHKLSGVPREKRGAQFRAVIAFRAKPESRIITVQGILRGYILEKATEKVIPGFPFLSVFYAPSLNRALSELSMEEEAVVSHRGQAFQKLLPILKKELSLES